MKGTNMIPSDGYRFRQVETERGTLLKGDTSWYRIADRGDRELLFCRVVGGGMSGPSTFHRRREDPNVCFRLEPRRKLMNLAFDVAEGLKGPSFAVIRTKTPRGMLILDPDDRERCRLVDLRQHGETAWEGFLSSKTTRYALARGRELLGRLQPLEGIEAAVAALRPPGLFARLLRKRPEPRENGWSLEWTAPPDAILDHRPLLAAVVLLVEQALRPNRRL